MYDNYPYDSFFCLTKRCRKRKKRKRENRMRKREAKVEALRVDNEMTRAQAQVIKQAFKPQPQQIPQTAILPVTGQRVANPRSIQPDTKNKKSNQASTVKTAIIVLVGLIALGAIIKKNKQSRWAPPVNPKIS